MLNDFSMPWWAWLYLSMVLSLYVAGFFFEKDTEFERDMNEVVASTGSFFSICIFVVGAFFTPVADLFGPMVIPMVLIGLYWEFTSAISQSKRAQLELNKEHELSDEERVFLLNVAIGFNAGVVVPGYTAGLYLCLKFMGLL